MNRRRSLRRLRFTLAAALLVQGVGGILVAPLKNQELFPIYAWLLFPLTPVMKPQYDLRITEAGGHRFDPPVYFRSAPDGVKRGHTITAERIIQEWGQAVREGNAAAARQRRELLEGRYLALPAEYTLVEQHFEVIRFWKTRKPDSEYELEHHRANAP